MLTAAQLKNIGFDYIMQLLEPCSPYGEQLKLRMKIYSPAEHDELTGELENVKRLSVLYDKNKDAFTKTERALMLIKDIRPSLRRSLEFTLTDVELFELKLFLIRLNGLCDAYRALCGGMKLNGVDIHIFNEALDIIDPDGMRAMSFRISDSCSETLASARKERRRVDILLRGAEGEEKEALIIKRTLLAAEEENEDARLRGLMTEALRKYVPDMEKVTNGIAKFDFALAKVRLMKKTGGIIPKIHIAGAALPLRVKGMKNPAVENALEARGRSFVPIDIELNIGAAVITGANMGGKSVALKTLALNARLALSGCPVFCEEAEIPHFYGIYMLCEEIEDTFGALSSFGGEILRFNDILKAQKREGLSLVLIDEFARGTNPSEGSALARAAVRYFNADNRAFALITTHFDGVARYAAAHYQVMGLKNADKTALNKALSRGGKAAAGVLENFMDYGLYRAAKDAEPPKDALTVCRALSVSEDFMKFAE